MNQNQRCILLGLLLLACQSMRTAGEVFTLQPESIIRLDGVGTMHSWSAQTRSISGQWETTAAWLSLSTITLPQQLDSRLTVSIPAVSIHSIDLTGKPINALEGRLIRHLIQSERHPEIFFTLDQLTLTNMLHQPTASWDFTVQGKLALAGLTNTINFPAQLTKSKPTDLRITGTTQLRLKDFAIEPPHFQPAPDSKSKAHPPINIFNNEVKLTFDLVFEPTMGKAPAK